MPAVLGGFEPSITRLRDGRVLIVGGYEDEDYHPNGASAPPIATMRILE
jgi:hypothetical protein